MHDLADALDKGGDITNIKSLWVKAGGYVHKNPIGTPIQDLDALPLPDRELFDFDAILESIDSRVGSRIADVLATRGCPFNCGYCCNHALRGLYPQGTSYVRHRSVNNVLEEIRHLVARYRVEGLIFEDDSFTLNKKWIMELLERYGREFRLPFDCNTHPTTLLDKDIVFALKEAGCQHISIGIETGNQWLRKEVLKRPVSNDQIKQAFHLVREAGIKTTSFNIVGLPYETKEMVEETIELNRLVNADAITVSIFYPYPGTHLYEVCKAAGWLTSEEKSTFVEGTILNQPSLSPKETMQAYRKLHHLELEMAARDRYPKIYPLYNLIKRLLGRTMAFRILVIAKGLLLLLFYCTLTVRRCLVTKS